MHLLCRLKATNYSPLLYQFSIVFLSVVILFFFFFYQRLSSKAVYVDFMVQTSLLQWIMWYF